MEIHTTSAQETQKLGEKTGHSLVKNGKGEQATILTLRGELGSGKTTFVKGLARGLGIKRRILSPTFILSREYPLKNSIFKKFIHIDLYRLGEQNKVESLGLEEILANPENLVVIEWPERLGLGLPKQVIRIEFKQMSETERLVSIKNLIRVT